MSFCINGQRFCGLRRRLARVWAPASAGLVEAMTSLVGGVTTRVRTLSHRVDGLAGLVKGRWSLVRCLGTLVTICTAMPVTRERLEPGWRALMQGRRRRTLSLRLVEERPQGAVQRPPRARGFSSGGGLLVPAEDPQRPQRVPPAGPAVAVLERKVDPAGMRVLQQPGAIGLPLGSKHIDPFVHT
jgi:hypothetical protein